MIYLYFPQPSPELSTHYPNKEWKTEPQNLQISLEDTAL